MQDRWYYDLSHATSPSSFHSPSSSPSSTFICFFQFSCFFVSFLFNTVSHLSYLQPLSPLHPLRNDTETKSLSYEKLCICSGAQPKVIAPHPNIIGLRDLQSVTDMAVRLSSARKVIIVGNGGIALELVHSVRHYAFYLILCIILSIIMISFYYQAYTLYHYFILFYYTSVKLCVRPYLLVYLFFCLRKLLFHQLHHAQVEIAIQFFNNSSHHVLPYLTLPCLILLCFASL